MKAIEIDFTNVMGRAEVLKADFPDFKIEITGSWLWVSGDTKPKRKELKDHGLRWSRKKEKWYLKGKPSARYGRKGADWSYIVDKYGLEELQTA
jgi:hypothetical protein